MELEDNRNGLYFVENSSYELLDEVREDLRTAVDYSESPDADEAERLLSNGDQILAYLEESERGPEERKHLVKSVTDHYSRAADQLDQDSSYFEEALEDVRSGIFAGIDQELHREDHTGISASKVNQLAENWRAI